VLKVSVFSFIISLWLSSSPASDYDDVIVKKATPSKIEMYWWNSELARPYFGFQFLFSTNNDLAYATNGGMYSVDLDRKPIGLFISEGKKWRPLKRANSTKYNFGMQPQGVFLVTKTNVAKVISIDEYSKLDEKNIRCATQSAPMLVLGSKINPKLTKSKSANRRNGVGVLPNGEVVIIYSRGPVTFQEFAQLFIEQGCISAMYLDGGISNLLHHNEGMWDGVENYGPFIGVKF
jgi:uncharacterized protein YigE (DUF2233 family)